MTCSLAMRYTGAGRPVPDGAAVGGTVEAIVGKMVGAVVDCSTDGVAVDRRGAASGADVQAVHRMMNNHQMYR
jgi:hypothetical protein